MVEIENEKLQEIKGGGFGLALIITAGVIFILGVIDGYQPQ